MKKFNLTIPKPCHQNWDQMTPDEKGRFCGACQKTVVDFTNMSDRELAAFFKKPAGSVCGRFHQDQLNREITVPKKRIPWLRYFFHIAWPAFIVMLKSCGTKDRTIGRSVTTLSATGSPSAKVPNDLIVGAVVTPVIPVEEEILEPVALKGEVAAVEVIDTISTIMGGIGIEVMEPVKDSVVTYEAVEEPDSAFVAMDTVVVTAMQNRCNTRVTMGAVAQVTEVNVHKGPPLHNAAESTSSALVAYPNPVKAGGILNIKAAEKEREPLSVQLLTSTGQRVLHQQVKGDMPVIPLSLPSNLIQGIYIVQVVYANGHVDKASVMVGY